jgi:hypothetical protein
MRHDQAVETPLLGILGLGAGLQRLGRRARLASMFLLTVWVGPVTFAQTDAAQLLKYIPASDRPRANARVIPAGQALILEPGAPLKLHLRDGSVVEGRFLGRTLLDSALYVPRFEAHMRSTNDVPLALGETLQILLHDGREVTAPFIGYGELTLLLLGPDGYVLRVPFEFAKTIHRANGDRVEPSALARAFRKGLLPSAEALALGEREPVGTAADWWASALQVAVDDIKSATVEQPSGTSVAGTVVLTVILTAVLLVVLIAASLHASSSSGCQGPSYFPPILSSAHLTTRPFDRSRGCYVGDALAVADPWPGPADDGQATALAVPETSAVAVVSRP